MPATEAELARILQALDEAAPVGRRSRAAQLDLAGVMEELNAWIGDNHQATNAFSANWASLISDALSAIEECGPTLTEALLADNPGLVDELRACRAILKGHKKAPDQALRRRIGKAASHLSGKIVDGPALQAAFDDLVQARTTAESRIRGRLLVSLCVEVGHDASWFPRRLRSILADDAVAIAVARGVPVPDDRRERAGVEPDERLGLVRGILGRPAERGRAVVWLRFVSADLGFATVLRIGERVTLFNDKWLRAVVHNDPAQLEAYAPEAASQDKDKNDDIELFVGEDNEEQQRRDEHSVVFLRVVAEDSTSSEAHRVARRTADTLSGIASLYGTPPRLWELDDSYVIRTTYGGGGAGFSAPPSRQLSVEDWAALGNDHTGSTLSDLAEKLGPHLPVTDPGIVHAATLLSWLRSARVAGAAPRLLLCDRVVEQVSGWAGFDDPRAFSSEVLRIAWAVSRVRNAVADAAFAAGDELRRGGAIPLADEFGDSGGSLRSTVNLKRFLELYASIVQTLDDNSQASDNDGVERVRQMAPRLASPAASRAWLREHLDSFTRNEERRRRTRNSLIHGGPLAQRTVEATVDFAETLATLALGDCIDGRLSGRDLIDHFLEQRADLDRVERRLAGGEPLSEALFWGGDGSS